MSPEEEEVNGGCAEQYEHGCQDCLDYSCPYRDMVWEDPTDESYAPEYYEEHEGEASS